MYMQFCPQCGRRLGSRLSEGRSRPACVREDGGCGFIDWGRFTVVARGVVLEPDAATRRVLLVMDPAGEWHLPGGHVDCEESAERTVVREVKEESGLDCALVGLLAFRSRVDPETNLTSAFFLLKPTGGQLRPDGDEVIEARFFALDELKTVPLPVLHATAATEALEHPAHVLPARTATRDLDRSPVTLFIGSST